MGPCDLGSARQEGKASRRGLCPAAPVPIRGHVSDHAGLNHKGPGPQRCPLLPQCPEWPQLVGKLLNPVTSLQDSSVPWPWPSRTLGAVGGAPHYNPPVWLRKRDHLLARLDIVHLHAFSQQLRDRKPALHVRRGVALTHSSKRHSAAPPTSHSPGILGPWGGGLAGVHRVFPVAGLPPPRKVNNPGLRAGSDIRLATGRAKLGSELADWRSSLALSAGVSSPEPSQWSGHSVPLPAPPHLPPGWSSASPASHLQGGLHFPHPGTLLLPACLWETQTPIPTQPLPGPGAADTSPVTCAISPWLSQDRLCPTS